QGKGKARFKVGYINRTGMVVIDPVFDEGTNFYEGLASVRIRSRWGVISTAGEFVIEPEDRSWCVFHEGLASVATKGKWGIVDRTGNYVVTPQYSFIGAFSNGLAQFRVGEANQRRYGFLDTNGKEAIPHIFNDVRTFSEGLAAAKVGNLWGYINTEGVFTITPRFEGTGKAKRHPDTRAGRFVHGLAPVWVGQDQYRFINKTGGFAFDATFSDVNAFCES